MEHKDFGLAYKIAEALGGSGPGPNGDYLCRCPAHPDESPSLSIKDDGDGLLVNCFAGCTSGAVFAALHRLGLLPEDAPASESAAPEEEKDKEEEDESGEDEPLEDPAETATKARAEERAQKLAQARAKFQKGWAAFGAQSAMHATVDAYCDWRGVSRFAVAPTWARFTPSGLHVGKDKNGQRFEQFFPMLVTAGENTVTGELLGGQREYLAYGGRGPAPVDRKERKKTVPGVSLRGAVARMGEPADGEFLVVGESWVTTRTVTDATGLAGWSVFGAAGLASFDPPANVKAVLFLAENDEDGTNAKALATVCPRLFERGIKIAVAAPAPGLGDFNDLVRLRDDGTRLHGTVEAGLAIVRDIVDKAKARARSKDDGLGAGAGVVPPLVDLPGLDGDEDGASKFSMTSSGLYRGRKFICPPFEVIAETHAIVEGKADDWGLCLRFRNNGGEMKEMTVSKGALHGDASYLAGLLMKAGLNIYATSAARNAFVEYLGRTAVKARMIAVKRTGWATINGAPTFVLPGQTIGANGDRVVLASEGRTVVYAQSGTLAEWQEHIGKPAGRHLLLQFGISVAWAGTLLQMSGGESGGFHLHEFSTKGKTTAQQVAASLWGNGALHGGFIQRWRATANSLEATFASASDTCLILDEISQLGYGEVATVVYTLTGEVGKGRLRSDATARTPYSWRALLLSSGETPIAARIGEDRHQKGGRSKELRGGATVRVIDIASDRAHGAFDQPADEPNFNPAAFAERMQEMASTFYGTAGPAFVKALLEDKISGADVRQAVNDFIAGVIENGSSDEARRGAARGGSPWSRPPA
jgi:hypothetical protein